jgi:catalase-peroxidase
MKMKKLAISATIAGALAIAAAPNAAVAEAAATSKPKGAIGMGVVVPKQAKSNQFWWPNQLDLSPLRDHDLRSNPAGDDFDYASEFAKLDLAAVKKDIDAMLTNSQDWWPADFGNYGPFFIRMTWHSAGTYRTLDGRGGADGGQQRFEPLNRPDLVYWGPEVEMLASDRHGQNGELQRPLGATHMGLIYVNPEGPMGKPDPVASARNIRIAFGRMAMNDEETVALVAGGHTFGKMHGARKPGDCVGVEPAGASVEDQGLGWKNKCGKGHSEDTTTSGLDGAWSQAPTKWTTLYLSNLLNFDWEQTRSPAGAIQWIPTDESLHKIVPDAHIEGKFNPPVMTTADLALKYDPEYRKITARFLANPDEYQKAFAKAWYKLTHRDMGPSIRYLGDEVPAEELIWQDPIASNDYKLVNGRDIRKLKEEILDSGLSVSELVRTAWASASSFRASDMRGGANGARVALAPQNGWEANNPQELARVLAKLTDIQQSFNDSNRRKVSLADLIVLGGAAAIEKAADEAGVEVEVPFAPGRGDATQPQTDVDSFALLEPTADGFRNYFNQDRAYRSPAEMLVDRADQLSLTVPEMTALVGGLRVLDANYDGGQHGVFTDRPGTLSNDFFVNLLDMGTQWRKAETAGIYEGTDRESGAVKYTATPVDLIFGSNSELRAVAEAYAFANANEGFVNDFVDAWLKVMQADRFDLKN